MKKFICAFTASMALIGVSACSGDGGTNGEKIMGYDYDHIAADRLDFYPVSPDTALATPDRYNVQTVGDCFRGASDLAENSASDLYIDESWYFECFDDQGQVLVAGWASGEKENRFYDVWGTIDDFEARPRNARGSNVPTPQPQ